MVSACAALGGRAKGSACRAESDDEVDKTKLWGQLEPEAYEAEEEEEEVSTKKETDEE